MLCYESLLDPHAVQKFATRERVCYSYFIRYGTYEASYETTIPVRSNKKMSNDWIPSAYYSKIEKMK